LSLSGSGQPSLVLEAVEVLRVVRALVHVVLDAVAVAVPDRGLEDEAKVRGCSASGTPSRSWPLREVPVTACSRGPAWSSYALGGQRAASVAAGHAPTPRNASRRSVGSPEARRAGHASLRPPAAAPARHLRQRRLIRRSGWTLSDLLAALGSVATATLFEGHARSSATLDFGVPATIRRRIAKLIPDEARGPGSARSDRHGYRQRYR
jgi:hypothetical protein